MCILAVGIIACTEKNVPVDNTGGNGTGTSGEVNDTTGNHVENQVWADTLYIAWNGNSATVTGELDSIEVSNSNGYVSIHSSVNRLITYILSGNGTGQFTIYGSIKHNLTLDGLTLTCNDGPAINNQCHKKCFVVVNGTNSLTDGSNYAASNEDRKAALFSEGQLIFSGSGSLTVKGNYKHAIASDDYIHLTEELTGTLNLTAATDGLHANDAMYINGGTTNITAGSDGVECDSTITIGGGSLTISADGDGIQSDTTDIIINGGTINITKAGDKGIVAFRDITINGGTIRVNSEYKCIKAGKKENNKIVSAGNIHITKGDIQVICNGTSSSSGGGGNPWGGSSSSDSSSPEGIEAKGTIVIDGGYVYAQSADDAINSGGDLTINDGYVMAYSTSNDGIDANGNMYIKGGLVYAIGSSDPEVALDANTEQSKQLYIQGGTIIALGKLERGASLSQACYQNSSWTESTWYSITIGSETFAFQTPKKQSSQSGGGHGPGGGSSKNTPLVVSGSSKPTVKSGVSVSGGTTIFNGMGVQQGTISGGSTITLSTYSSSSY